MMFALYSVMAVSFLACLMIIIRRDKWWDDYLKRRPKPLTDDEKRRIDNFIDSLND